LERRRVAEAHEPGQLRPRKEGRQWRLKHPRWRNYKQKTTTDPDRIREWFRQFANANYGVVTGSSTIAVDVDMRPDANGLLTLDCLEMSHGERIPYTVEVLTGRGNGSRHLYFRLPLHTTVGHRRSLQLSLATRIVWYNLRETTDSQATKFVLSSDFHSRSYLSFQIMKDLQLSVEWLSICSRLYVKTKAALS
jgi:hypothetical protein